VRERGLKGDRVKGAENNEPEVDILQTCSMPNKRVLSANSLQLGARDSFVSDPLKDGNQEA
jgi:hypothetical protein